jgi:hydroxymethylpyrimidine/phosphomethylpyrimidine kinase
VPPDVVVAQLDAVDDDLRVAAAKIGLIPTRARCRADRLRRARSRT